MFPILIYIWIVISLQLQQSTQVVGQLPSEVRETSGLAYFDGILFTHNDSGKAAKIYQLDVETADVLRTVNILNAQNQDWEDMDQDEDHVYIADIGNTFGERKELVIYRVSKKDVREKSAVIADSISFHYEGHDDYSRVGRSEWDAEAIAVMGDSIIIFTKSWQSQTTRAYAIPKTPGNHTAKLVGQFDVNGLVTGATYDAQANLIYLSGYSKLLQPFIVKIEGMKIEDIFAGEVRKIGLDMNFSQVEGIATKGNGMYYLSSERFTAFDANLYKMHTQDGHPESP